MRISAAAVIMALVVQILKYPLNKIFNLDYFWGVFGQGAVAGVAGLAIYALLCWLLKVPELTELKESFARRWFRARSVGATDIIDSKE